MSGNKCVTLIFKTAEDFDVCNKYMKVEEKDIGIWTNKEGALTKGKNISEEFPEGQVCARFNTGNSVLPPGTLTVKSTRGDISIKVISGVAETVGHVVNDGIIYPLGN